MNRIREKMRKIISSKISIFLERFGYIKVLNKDRALRGITDADVLQALIFNALMVGIDLKAPTKAEHLQDLARGVVFRLKKLNALSLTDFLKTVEQPIEPSRFFCPPRPSVVLRQFLLLKSNSNSFGVL